MIRVSFLALVALVGACTTTPSRNAVTQLQAAKKLDPTSPVYASLAAMTVDCPVGPAVERRRNAVCSQLWAFNASGCLKVYQQQTLTLFGATATDEQAVALRRSLDCMDTASAAALASLPQSSVETTPAMVLTLLTIRARAIERRRENRSSLADTQIDNAEIGSVAARMTSLPGGAAYAAYFLSGSAIAQIRIEHDPVKTCQSVQAGLQLLPSDAPITALAGPLSTRRAILETLRTRLCK